MEDAVVDIGAIGAGPADLGRLMLRECVLINGDDWFIVPLEVRVGSAVRIESLVITDTLGTAQVVPHYTQTNNGGRWRMFAICGEPPPHGLLVPSVLVRSIVGKPLEQVIHVRDKAANMPWGIERIVLGAAGTPRDRTSVALAPPTSARPGLRYELGSTVPNCYIPSFRSRSTPHRGACSAQPSCTPTGRPTSSNPSVTCWEAARGRPRKSSRAKACASNAATGWHVRRMCQTTFGSAASGSSAQAQVRAACSSIK